MSNATKSISEHAAAAKAIKAELKAAFPAIKFSVKSESFSMGDAVHISWTDGPTSPQVSSIVDKYQYGSFNGMEDLYEYDNRREDIPQTKYVQTSRHFSDEAKAEMCQKMGIDFATEYNILNTEKGDYNSTLVRIELSAIDFTATVETEKSGTEKRFVTVTFPQLNKNNTLFENFEACVMHGTNDQKCLVQKTVELEADEYETVANSLLENRAELWEKIGGAWSDAPELENVTYIQMCNSKELTQIFRDTCYTLVVEVIEKVGRGKFYVNTEGYDYARYVGVVTRKNEPVEAIDMYNCD